MFDTFCSKMNQIKHKSGKNELDQRVCTKCGIYYPTLKALNTHLTQCTTTISTSDEDDEDIELDQVILIMSDNFKDI